MSEKKFDPKDHISHLKNDPTRPYMEVKWRIAWFRSEFPRGQVSTQLVSHSDTGAIVRAEVTAINEGGEIAGTATGYGSCTAQEFREYIEKAETKAIGRALGLLGFGTQFADDFADAEDGAIADAPVNLRNNSQGGQRTPRAPQGSHRATGGGRGGNRATKGQMDMIRIMGAERGIEPEQMNQLIAKASNGQETWDAMTFDTASALITEMKTIPRMEHVQN